VGTAIHAAAIGNERSEPPAEEQESEKKRKREGERERERERNQGIRVTKTNRSRPTVPCRAAPRRAMPRSRIRSVAGFICSRARIGLLKINDSESDVNTIARTARVYRVDREE